MLHKSNKQDIMLLIIVGMALEDSRWIKFEVFEPYAIEDYLKVVFWVVITFISGYGLKHVISLNE
jgi:hypothetical protein